MGIQIEFNPDLALRNIEEFRARRRKKEECVPNDLAIGKEYEFLKKEQRCYWLYGQVPLIETNGKELSSPIAGVRILEATHFLENGTVWTRGKYKIIEIYGHKGEGLDYDHFQRNGFGE